MLYFYILQFLLLEILRKNFIFHIYKKIEFKY